MQVVLKILNGPSANSMSVLRQGQALKVGRTSWADLTINDDALAEIHFQLEVAGTACTLRKIAADETLALNGEETEESQVYDGDEILAGNTRFHLTVEGGDQREAAGDDVAAAKGSGFPHVEILTAALVVPNCELDEESLELMQEDDNPREYIERLNENGKPGDAITVLTHALPKREAVWWGCRMVKPGDESFDQTAYTAVKNWVLDPSEENRKAAEAAANNSGVLSPAVCLATAVYLSGGSLVDPEIAEVPPAEHITATMVAATLKSVAMLADPQFPTKSLKQSLEVGIQIADGENRWE